MVGICEKESWVSSRNQENEETTEPLFENQILVQENEETEEIWARMSKNNSFSMNNRSQSDRTLLRSAKSSVVKKKKHVLLEGYVDDENDDDIRRTKSLTDDDLDELKGCLDLGFGFSYDEIPELCNTLPALELCYSMSQKFLDEKHGNNDKALERSDSSSAVSESSSSSPIANWKISSPGDHPEDVKARLKFWAQAVACTVRLCS